MARRRIPRWQILGPSAVFLGVFGLALVSDPRNAGAQTRIGAVPAAPAPTVNADPAAAFGALALWQQIALQQMAIQQAVTQAQQAQGQAPAAPPPNFDPNRAYFQNGAALTTVPGDVPGGGFIDMGNADSVATVPQGTPPGTPSAAALAPVPPAPSAPSASAAPSDAAAGPANGQNPPPEGASSAATVATSIPALTALRGILVDGSFEIEGDAGAMVAPAGGTGGNAEGPGGGGGGSNDEAARPEGDVARRMGASAELGPYASRRANTGSAGGFLAEDGHLLIPPLLAALVLAVAWVVRPRRPQPR
jgi:hypothetical protein